MGRPWYTRRWTTDVKPHGRHLLRSKRGVSPYSATFRRVPVPGLRAGPLDCSSVSGFLIRVRSTAGPVRCGGSSQSCSGTGGYADQAISAGHQACPCGRLPTKQKHRDCAGSTSCGGCVSRHLQCFGFTVLLLPRGPTFRWAVSSCPLPLTRAGCRTPRWGTRTLRHLGRQGGSGGRRAAGSGRTTKPTPRASHTVPPTPAARSRVPSLGPQSTGAHQKHLPRGAAHRVAPGASVVQDSSWMGHAWHRRDDMPYTQTPLAPISWH